ncbi:MAG: cobalamin-dependent protein [Patescibacteria group bacterium]|jgi:excisionase family DNA binding protein
MQNVHFSPPEIAKLFEVNVSTIKRWVDKGFLKAQITAGGHRRISQEELALFVKRYPKNAKKSYVLRRLKKKPEPTKDEWKEYYRALASNDITAAERVLEALYLQNIPVPVILDHIIAPTLKNIGDEWRKGHISIYEEHRMSFLIRLQLFRIGQLIPEVKLDKKNVAVLACVIGEQHEIPLHMIALVMKLHGWTTHILGINISTVEVIKAAQKLQPSLVGLSKIFTEVGSLEYLNAIATYTKKHHAKLVYGGGGWSKVVRERTWRGTKNIRYLASLTDFDKQLREWKQ